MYREKLRVQLWKLFMSSPEIQNGLTKLGVKVDDVFPIGIVVQPDGVSIRGHMSPADIGKLGDLLPNISGIRDIRVFPRGIVAPETFRVHVNLAR